MKSVKNEEKYYGTKEAFRTFLVNGNYRKVSTKFCKTGRVYINPHAWIVRAYLPKKNQPGEICWRVIPYDPTTCLTWVGYKLVTIDNKQYTMHQIMAHTWLDNDDPDHKTDVDHIDGNKANNELNNLRWVTKEENMQTYFAQRRLREAAGETGLNAFIKELQSQYKEYIPQKRIYLNLIKKEN